MATRNHLHAKSGSRSRSRSDTARLRREAVQVGGNIQQMGSIAKDAAQHRIEELRDAASEYYELGLDKVQEVEQSVEEYITKQPVKSVLIAAGIGLIVGRFLMRR